jgi:hypothetical protein
MRLQRAASLVLSSAVSMVSSAATEAAVDTPIARTVQTVRTVAGQSGTVDECPRADRVQLNLTGWKASLKRAETRERRDELLREMNLSLTFGDSDTSEASDDGDSVVAKADATLLGIEDSPVHLELARFPDHVLDVRYQIRTPTGKTVVHLIQVLRPLGGPDWCRLGIDLSRREDEDSKLETYALGFVSLLDAKTKAIEVQMVDSRLRHSETTRQYWVTDGFRLAKVFDQQIASMDNRDEGRATTAKIGKLVLIGDFPKRIELKQVTKHVVCVNVTDDVPCSESEGTSVATFVYNGKTYVRRK